MHILEYFTTHEWEFSIDNLYKLLGSIEHPKDKEDFDFDIRFVERSQTPHVIRNIDTERMSRAKELLLTISSSRPIDWLPFLENYILGVRKYVLNEDPSTLPAARRNLNRLVVVENLFLSVSR